MIKFFQTDYNYVQFRGDRDVLSELREKYAFYAPNYKWDKRYRAGYWDGKISMINMKDLRFYAGLLSDIKLYLDSEGIEYDDSGCYQYQSRTLSEEQVKDFYKRINGPFVPHDSQILAIQHCLQHTRNIILAPTSNGKSYIIHGLNAYYTKQKKKVLIVIDRAQLVLQLKSNFVDEYGSNKLYSTDTIYDDTGKSDVVVTTWQSIVDHPASWFKQFDVLIGDEVHKFKAKSLIKIMELCSHIEFRHGLTATLDNDSKTDALTLKGMFGPSIQTTTLQEQIEEGISARPIVYIVHLKYPQSERQELRKLKSDAVALAKAKGKGNEGAVAFQTESEYLENHTRRTEMIANIAMMQKGNTLIAFKKEEHGRSLYKHIEVKYKKNHYFVSGKVNKDKRFAIQGLIKKLKESVSVVSFGTFSTGINIPNLNNLIIGSQVKSSITVPQLIGRMVRVTEDKTTTNIIDICDDLRTSDGMDNIFMLHFKKRMEYYVKNNFEIKTKVIVI